ncbi:MAG TPA: UDP-N-acetylmuramoyl-L-alanine--D-glutamate ligase [Candidatus Avacidaminococcus intestinavium]|uniref:UDP-N-acetylmuramoylalanine--D-glutamate ligase n=1 Tax=Candidatus Avacidaminococcus intestinavium TaxID=2840684 RepID=A0A9D1MNY4_9FIRM|nr:UDP-N-acetylmuramoyl-L-alanine--D-glutamate ligase [Candidatus Avacidaminococcus intestinavium]
MPENKYVFIYGAGISGCGIAEVLFNKGQRVILFNDEERTLPTIFLQALEANGGRYICNKRGEELLPEVALMIISPGISMKNSLILQALRCGIEVIGEVEAAMRFYQGKLIAITGTNGKTTTTTLVGEMMKSLPTKSAVGGNIGLALSVEARELKAQDWLIAELSSFQLESVISLKPNIAAILNITPDHLDRHGSMDEYIKAKSNIFLQQNQEDYLLLNYDDKAVAALQEKAQGTVCFFSRQQALKQGIFIEDGKFIIAWQGVRQVVCGVKEMKLFGAHNEENALAAIGCAFFAGVKQEAISHVLTTFAGVEHRIEFITTINGVAYYNDSKATNPDSTIKALEAFAGHIILIAGGRDKHTDLTRMMQLVAQQTDALILLGEAKERFLAAALAADVQNVYEVETMDEAVLLAYKIAQAQQVVLLSPACSSFDMFDNFPHRGKYFKQLVYNLVKA